MRREYLPAKLLAGSVLSSFFSLFYLFFSFEKRQLLLLMIMNKIVSYNFLKGKAKGKETGIPEEFVQ